MTKYEAAFATSLLVENSEVDLSPQYRPLLAALRPLFVITPDSSSAKLNAQDNAAGAVARLLLCNTAAIPLDQVLPVFLEALPLKNDLENRAVFGALFHRFRANLQVLHPFIDRLLHVFEHVLEPSLPYVVLVRSSHSILSLDDAEATVQILGVQERPYRRLDFIPSNANLDIMIVSPIFRCHKMSSVQE
jgi:hypothetical protein